MFYTCCIHISMCETTILLNCLFALRFFSLDALKALKTVSMTSSWADGFSSSILHVCKCPALIGRFVERWQRFNWPVLPVTTWCDWVEDNTQQKGSRTTSENNHRPLLDSQHATVFSVFVLCLSNELAQSMSVSLTWHVPIPTRRNSLLIGSSPWKLWMRQIRKTNV